MNLSLVLLLGHEFDTRGLFILCTCILPLHFRIFFMSLMNSICKSIKVQERFHLLGWPFLLNFSLVLLLSHGYDTRGLFRLCTCFHLCTIEFFHEFDEFNLQVHKSIGTVSFVEMAFLYWVLFGSTIWCCILL